MSSRESWDLRIDPDVFRFLKKIPRNNAEAVLGVVKLLSFNPYFGDVQKTKGMENTWRRRVGDFRIFYKIIVSEKIILVFRVERRTSATY